MRRGTGPIIGIPGPYGGAAAADGGARVADLRKPAGRATLITHTEYDRHHPPCLPQRLSQSSGTGHGPGVVGPTAEGVAAVTTSQQPRQCALEFEALPHRIPQVRRIVSAHLHHWNLDPVLDTVLLGVTELLANVHRHAGPDKHCTVELFHDEERLTVTVSDRDPRPPRGGLPADPLATGGRGLALIEALTDGWGSRPAGPGGKVVWFTLRVPLRPAAHRAVPLAGDAPRGEAAPVPALAAAAPAPQPAAPSLV